MLITYSVEVLLQPKTSCDICISDFAHGKIRYVGGRAVAKVKYHNTNLVRNDLRNFGQIYNQQAKVKVSLLQTIIVSQADVECSKYSRSIIDVKRKQNLSCGLTNISDNTFEFFLELEKIRILYIVKINLGFMDRTCCSIFTRQYLRTKNCSVYGLVYFLNCRPVCLL